jgi:hypothetical protein
MNPEAARARKVVHGKAKRHKERRSSVINNAVACLYTISSLSESRYEY